MCTDMQRMRIPQAHTQGLPAACGHPDQHSEEALLGTNNHLCTPSTRRKHLAMQQSAFSLPVPVPACTHGTRCCSRCLPVLAHEALASTGHTAKATQRPCTLRGAPSSHTPCLYFFRSSEMGKKNKPKPEKKNPHSFGLKLSQDIRSLPRVIPSLVVTASSQQFSQHPFLALTML